MPQTLQKALYLAMPPAVLQSMRDLLVQVLEAQTSLYGYVIIAPVICVLTSPGCLRQHYPIGIGGAESIPNIRICRWR